jgi:hypothetical protein
VQDDNNGGASQFSVVTLILLRDPRKVKIEFAFREGPVAA